MVEDSNIQVPLQWGFSDSMGKAGMALGMIMFSFSAQIASLPEPLIVSTSVMNLSTLFSVEL